MEVALIGVIPGSASDGDPDLGPDRLTDRLVDGDAGTELRHQLTCDDLQFINPHGNDDFVFGLDDPQGYENQTGVPPETKDDTDGDVKDRPCRTPNFPIRQG